MGVRYATSWGLIALLAASTASQAQVILVGSTANNSTSGPTSKLVDIDINTGAISNPRDTGIFLIGGIATQPLSGQLFGLTTVVSNPPNSLIRLDLSTGAHTVVGATNLPFVVEGDVAFNPTDGFLYGVQDAGSDFSHRYFFRLNSVTGSATVVADFGPNGDFSSLAFNGAGTLYCIDNGVAGNSRLLTIDPNSGAVTTNIAMNVHLGGANGMTFHPESGVAYVADGSMDGTALLYTLDVSSGILSSIGPLGIPGGISGLAFFSVPEPSSLALLLPPIVALIRRVKRVNRIS